MFYEFNWLDMLLDYYNLIKPLQQNPEILKWGKRRKKQNLGK